jgi:hypothetical protein
MRSLQRLNPFRTAQIVSSAEPGDVVRVERRDAGALSFDVQRGDVGEADDPFGLVAEAGRPYAMGNPIEAVPASGGDHGARPTIRQSFRQLAQPARVGPRQETVSLEQTRSEDDFITIMEPAEPPEHERTVEWPRRGYHSDSVAWAERRRNDEG